MHFTVFAPICIRASCCSSFA